MKAQKLTILFFALLALTSCGDDGEDIIIEPNNNGKGNTIQPVANENRNTIGVIPAQTRLEFPKLKGGKNVVVIHHAELNKNTKQSGINYSIEWDPTINAQRWSCYQMYSSINYNSGYNVSRYYADNDGSLSEECQYPNDPDLPSQYQMTADPYKYNGYDHGHICPSADRLRSKEANFQTFYITNMQPQRNVFNAGIWNNMEAAVRSWAAASDTLFVCKGGTIDKEEHILGYLTDQIVHKNKIPIPRYFFMAVLSKKGSNYKAMGFWVEHLNEDHTYDALSNYAYSIDQLEEMTDLDFFCNLPDDIENNIEKTLNKASWNLK